MLSNFVCPLFAISLWTVSPSIGWSYLLSDLAQASPLGGTSVCRKSPLSPSRLQKLRFPPGFWGNISGFRHFLAIFYRKSINIRFPIDKSSPFRYNIYRCRSSAGVAQLVEQLICNQQVGGSSPSASSILSVSFNAICTQHNIPEAIRKPAVMLVFFFYPPSVLPLFHNPKPPAQRTGGFFV